MRVRFAEEAGRPLAVATLAALAQGWDEVVGARGHPTPWTDGDAGPVAGMAA